MKNNPYEKVMNLVRKHERAVFILRCLKRSKDKVFISDVNKLLFDTMDDKVFKC